MSSYHIALIIGLISAAAADVYISANGLQCMSPQFVETQPGVFSMIHCAVLCDVRLNCQAFSMADGPCQLFVFHRCSKYVRDCSCSRRVQVFVKQLPGLPPGAMCPAGFKDDFCGTKYQIYRGFANWTVANATIGALPGMTIFADVADAAESNYLLLTLMPKYNLTDLPLGGFQTPGSSEPKGGWYWVGCGTNISSNSSLWLRGQPDNAGGDESVVFLRNVTSFGSGIVDTKIIFVQISLAECVSPFD